ncbi:MAG: M48 family metalloprotease [Actinomycetota bacterium]|nr:M48 family metalloprotease [Actinomycetota bacterium]
MAVPLLVSCLLSATGRRIGGRLPPATAVRLLTAAAVLTALSTGFVLGVAGFYALAQVPVVATLGGWSVTSVAMLQSTELVASGACGAVVLLLLGAATRRLMLTGGDLARAAVACHRLGRGVDGLIVIDDDQPDAYALPGLTGRVVVSTSMLRALPANERRVLLAHEAAHLRHHHHLFALLTDLGTAANPLLRPLSGVVRDAIERWADEDAAAEVADRRLAARAIARAGLARARAITPRRLNPAALGAVDTRVSDRAKALLAPHPRPRRMLVAAITVLVVAGGAAAATTAATTEHRFEVARQYYQLAPQSPVRGPAINAGEAFHSFK